MTQHSLPSRLRIHRTKSGLSQRELAYILGYTNVLPIIRHERAARAPLFLTALAYQAVFRIPVAELFPGFAETVAYGVEKRLGELERSLQEKDGKGRNARSIARKLEWITARRIGIEI